MMSKKDLQNYLQSGALTCFPPPSAPKGKSNIEEVKIEKIAIVKREHSSRNMLITAIKKLNTGESFESSASKSNLTAIVYFANKFLDGRSYRLQKQANGLYRVGRIS